MMIRRTLTTLLAAGTLVLAAGCADDELTEAEDDAPAQSSGGGSVTIATQSFDEAALMAAMYAAVLEDAGYDVETKSVTERGAYLKEMPGGVDLAPEYVGGLTDYLNTTVNGEDAESLTTTDTQETVDNVAPLLEEKGLTLLEPSEATSANAYFVTEDYALENSVTKLSQLAGESVVLAAHPDCTGRSDCEAGLKEVYDIDVTKVLPLGFASPQTYQAVLDGEAQLGQTGTLDGTLESQGLVMLEDDKEIQPAQNLVPLVSDEFLAEHEDVEGPLNELMGALDNETLAELLVRVSVDREKPADVATDFLTEEGLL